MTKDYKSVIFSEGSFSVFAVIWQAVTCLKSDANWATALAGFFRSSAKIKRGVLITCTKFQIQT
jgi:hypothetical protein